MGEVARGSAGARYGRIVCIDTVCLVRLHSSSGRGLCHPVRCSPAAFPGRTETGFVRPDRSPRIDPNYFGDERDWHSFRLATELCRDIGADRAYDEFRKEEVLPGGGKLTDAEWRQFLAKSVSTFFHPVSTCRMGVDETAVVDPQLRVYGVEGLRVADASIMPSITTTNTNAASILIGWKCARMILQDWR
ncbi:GMC oxidoreductase [Neorhizobium galegae]|uniref:GMC oxidoreductase n=1 Tax=Neorhizobium galegae TaxID=399 RepID=UPI001F2F2103|nr:GMC oxidoreductase [Neorhizobium galegae]UIK07794.1 GMC oxidoreductase [Neorhizobium galegae]